MVRRVGDTAFLEASLFDPGDQLIATARAVANVIPVAEAGDAA